MWKLGVKTARKQAEEKGICFQFKKTVVMTVRRLTSPEQLNE